MKIARKVLGTLFVAISLTGCDSAWVVFPKYPAPYSYPHHEKVEGAAIGINSVTAEVSLGQNRGIYDYESPTPISLHVTIRAVDKMAANGLVKLEKVAIVIAGETRYVRRFKEVAVTPGAGKRKVEGVYCSSTNSELSFKIVELPPQVTLEAGQTLTIHAVVAVTSRGITERAEVSSQYLGTTKRGVMRRTYVP